MAEGVRVDVSADVDKTCHTWGCFPKNSIELLVNKAAADMQEAGVDISAVTVDANCKGQISAIACNKVCQMAADIEFLTIDDETQQVHASFEGIEGKIVTAPLNPAD